MFLVGFQGLGVVNTTILKTNNIYDNYDFDYRLCIHVYFATSFVVVSSCMIVSSFGFVCNTPCFVIKGST